jgi:hypothetical protein
VEPAVRAAAGANVTVRVELVYVTVAFTGVALPCGVSVTVLLVRVLAFIASEKTACTLLVTDTPVAALTGTVLVTIGGVVSAVPVVRFTVAVADLLGSAALVATTLTV